jgi:hypothetical protein
MGFSHPHPVNPALPDSPGFAVFANASSELGLWLITREKTPAAIGGWQLVKKGGCIKKRGNKQFLRYCEFLNRIYEFSVFTMAVYGKNLGKTKTDNSKNGFCIHNGGIILNIYIKVAFFCCPYELPDISRRIQTDFHFIHVIHADISFRTVSKFFSAAFTVVGFILCSFGNLSTRPFFSCSEPFL